MYLLMYLLSVEQGRWIDGLYVRAAAVRRCSSTQTANTTADADAAADDDDNAPFIALAV